MQVDPKTFSQGDENKAEDHPMQDVEDVKTQV